MASIDAIKNKNGEITSYRIRVFRGRDADGKQLKPFTKTWKIPPTFKSEKAIQRELAKVAGQFESDCNAGKISTENYTLYQYAEIYIELAERDCKPATVTFYRSMLPFFKDDIGTTKLKQLRPEHLEAFYNRLRTENVKQESTAKATEQLAELKKKSGKTQKEIALECGLSEGTLRNAIRQKNVTMDTARKIAEYFKQPLEKLFTVSEQNTGLSQKSIRHIHNFIHAILREAETKGAVAYNVANKIKPPKVKNHEAEFFELSEILTIKEALDNESFKFRTATYLLMDTGIRRGELLGIRWKSVDFTNRTIRIENNVVYTPEHGITTNSPKNGECRTVNISPELIPVLKDYKKYQKQQARILFSHIENDVERMRALTEYNPDGYLFIQEDTGKVMHPTTLNAFMIKLSKKVGLHIHPHKFRHSQASLLYASNVDIVTISKRLGHKQVSTTQNIYAHMMEKSDRQASDTISNLIFKQA